MVELGVVARARSYGNARIGRSGATMWKIISKETTFKGGEHHTRGTRTDDKNRILAIAIARRLCQRERDGMFPMLGKDKGKGETIEHLAKYVDIKIVSLV